MTIPVNTGLMLRIDNTNNPINWLAQVAIGPTKTRVIITVIIKVVAGTKNIFINVGVIFLISFSTFEPIKVAKITGNTLFA